MSTVYTVSHFTDGLGNSRSSYSDKRKFTNHLLKPPTLSRYHSCYATIWSLSKSYDCSCNFTERCNPRDCTVKSLVFSFLNVVPSKDLIMFSYHVPLYVFHYLTSNPCTKTFVLSLLFHLRVLYFCVHT